MENWNSKEFQENQRLYFDPFRLLNDWEFKIWALDSTRQQKMLEEAQRRSYALLERQTVPTLPTTSTNFANRATSGILQPPPGLYNHGLNINQPHTSQPISQYYNQVQQSRYQICECCSTLHKFSVLPSQPTTNNVQSHQEIRQQPFSTPATPEVQEVTSCSLKNSRLYQFYGLKNRRDEFSETTRTVEEHNSHFSAYYRSSPESSIPNDQPMQEQACVFGGSFDIEEILSTISSGSSSSKAYSGIDSHAHSDPGKSNNYYFENCTAEAREQLGATYKPDRYGYDLNNYRSTSNIDSEDERSDMETLVGSPPKSQDGSVCFSALDSDEDPLVDEVSENFHSMEERESLITCSTCNPSSDEEEDIENEKTRFVATMSSLDREMYSYIYNTETNEDVSLKRRLFHCCYCCRNKQCFSIYTSHNFKDKFGYYQCPFF